MKILHLTLKKKWFDMTDSGEKTEEYREIKPYWISRLIDCGIPEESPGENNVVPHNIVYDIFENGYYPNDVLKAYRCSFKKFDVVIAMNGYGERPVWRRECVEITIGEGREEWGAYPDRLYFIIKLGEKI